MKEGWEAEMEAEGSKDSVDMLKDYLWTDDRSGSSATARLRDSTSKGSWSCADVEESRMRVSNSSAFPNGRWFRQQSLRLSHMTELSHWRIWNIIEEREHSTTFAPEYPV